jgi:hypothetical protein
MNYIIKFFIKGGTIEIVRAETLAEAKALRVERFAQGDCVSGIIGTEEEMAAMEAHFVRR